MSRVGLTDEQRRVAVMLGCDPNNTATCPLERIDWLLGIKERAGAWVFYQEMAKFSRRPSSRVSEDEGRLSRLEAAVARLEVILDRLAEMHKS